MNVRWLLFGAFFVVWRAALAAFILSVRDQGWRLNIRLLVALQALLLGAFVTMMRLEG
jgi:hypothetical protein